MALDLGLTTYQLLSALDGLAPNIQSRRRRLDDAIDRALAVPAGGAAFRTAAVGRRPYIAARTGPEGLLGSVEVPDWLVNDPELLALSHAMLVQQCQLGFGYPVAISEAHEQAVITGHDREEFRRLTLMLLEQQGLPTPESAKATSKRRPWV